MKFYDVIKFEGNNDTIVYKYPVEDFNNGSQLIVHESQKAFFLRDGQIIGEFGAGKYSLDTESVPFIKKLFKFISNGDSQFHCEVYFVNLVTIMNIKWGTDTKIRMYDPASGLHLSLGAYGEFSLHVADAAKLLLKVVGTESIFKTSDIIQNSNYSSSSIAGKFKALVISKVKSYLSKAIKENNIDILEVDESIDEISNYIKAKINEVFSQYGLEISEFYISNISTPDDDPNFLKLKEQHAAKYLKVNEEKIKLAEAEARKERLLLEAETEANLKILNAKVEEETLKRKAFAEAEKIKAEGLAKAEVMLAQNYTFEQETRRNVGMELAKNNTTSNVNGGISDMYKTAMEVGSAIELAKEANTTIKDIFKKSVDEIPTSNNENKIENVSSWVCPKCGHTGNTGKFCPECGFKNPPKLQKNVWTCKKCGHEGNTGKYCEECGEKVDNED